MLDIQQFEAFNALSLINLNCQLKVNTHDQSLTFIEIVYFQNANKYSMKINESDLNQEMKFVMENLQGLFKYIKKIHQEEKFRLCDVTQSQFKIIYLLKLPFSQKIITQVFVAQKQNDQFVSKTELTSTLDKMKKDMNKNYLQTIQTSFEKASLLMKKNLKIQIQKEDSKTELKIRILQRQMNEKIVHIKQRFNQFLTKFNPLIKKSTYQQQIQINQQKAQKLHKTKHIEKSRHRVQPPKRSGQSIYSRPKPQKQRINNNNFKQNSINANNVRSRDEKQMKWVWNPKEKRYEEEEQQHDDQQIQEEEQQPVKIVIEKNVPFNSKKLQNKNQANHSKPQVIDVQKFQFKIDLKDFIKQEDNLITSQVKTKKIRSESLQNHNDLQKSGRKSDRSANKQRQKSKSKQKDGRRKSSAIQYNIQSILPSNKVIHSQQQLAHKLPPFSPLFLQSYNKLPINFSPNFLPQNSASLSFTFNGPRLQKSFQPNSTNKFYLNLVSNQQIPSFGQHYWTIKIVHSENYHICMGIVDVPSEVKPNKIPNSCDAIYLLDSNLHKDGKWNQRDADHMVVAEMETLLHMNNLYITMFIDMNQETITYFYNQKVLSKAKFSKSSHKNKERLYPYLAVKNHQDIIEIC